MKKIGLGGSCHWCTEAIFQSLKGVEKVEQGWISSLGVNESFSEGVVVHFDPDQTDLLTLISVHLSTHSSTSDHNMRSKYRSAVYTYSDEQSNLVRRCIVLLQERCDKPIVTQVLKHMEFKPNQETYLDYYSKNPEAPFCQRYISPKLSLLVSKFSKVVNKGKLSRLTVKYKVRPLLSKSDYWN